MHLDDLLSQYDAARAAGTELTPEELCRGTPELLEPLRYHVRALRAMKGLPAQYAESPKPITSATLTSTLQVQALHARGGLGEVYRAHDDRLKRDVALKVITGQCHEERREIFEREAAITGKLEHPGIVPVHGVGRADDDRPCYVMRFVGGKTLGEVVEALHAAKSPLSRSNPEFRQLLSRLVQIGQTIAFAHSRGVIHRDLKPSNILLGEFGETLVVDWGLAAELRNADCGIRNEEKTVLGTPAFMSPEQARGDAVTPASDLFALGGLLYTILTGLAPYWGCSPPEILAGQVPPPRTRRADLPVALEAVCRKAMAFEPADRFADALDFNAEIERWLADESLLTTRDAFAVRLRRWTRRHRLLVAATVAGAGVALVSLAIATGLLSKSNADLRTANDLAAAREREAVANFRLACDAVDRFTVNVSEDPRLQEQDFDSLRKDLLESAKHFYKDLAANPRDEPAVRRQIVKAHLRLALIATQQGNRDAAVAEYRTATERAAEIPGEQAAESDAWLGLAATWLHVGKHADAREAARQAVRLREQLPDADPAGKRASLAEAHSMRAQILSDSVGDTPETMAAFETAIDLSRQNFRENSREIKNWKVLPEALLFRGILYGKADKLAEAEADWNAARDLATEILTPSTSPVMRELRVNIAGACNALGSLHKLHKNLPKAEAAYIQARDLFDLLAKTYPSILHYRHGQALGDANLGAVRFEAGDLDAARKLWHRAITAQSALVAASPNTYYFRHSLILTTTRLADADIAEGRPAAKAHLVKAESLLIPGKVAAFNRKFISTKWLEYAAKFPEDAGLGWDHALTLAGELARDDSPAQALAVLQSLVSTDCFKDQNRRDRLETPVFAKLNNDPDYKRFRELVGNMQP